MYSALDIAKWFIWKYKGIAEPGEPLTLLKLLKLLYYAEGSSLALNDRSLFSEDILAWEHGPIVAEVYKAFCSEPYNLPYDDSYCEIVKKIKSEDKAVLEEVFDVFGEYSAWGLRNKTHSETPWKDATDNGRKLNGVISREAIKRYFKENYIG